MSKCITVVLEHMNRADKYRLTRRQKTYGKEERKPRLKRCKSLMIKRGTENEFRAPGDFLISSRLQRLRRRITHKSFRTHITTQVKAKVKKVIRFITEGSLFTCQGRSISHVTNSGKGRRSIRLGRLEKGTKGKGEGRPYYFKGAFRRARNFVKALIRESPQDQERALEREGNRFEATQGGIPPSFKYLRSLNFKQTRPNWIINRSIKADWERKGV
ncbi:hypothetical protein PNOK_0129500 [Pyrrhoderma noxium]|uniref:Uncharacterized protein n=1 Tax=Pyrrhoderma noxium TaxID=2282107 RepID=A0A286UXA9_9AGAM|nr:hypothetical protein PNOK_0129500 [Pyrrhoderma noxium]